MRGCQRGFAYLWVLLLVAFLGVGLKLGLDVYFTALQRDKERELLAIGHQFRLAIERYVRVRAPGATLSAKIDYPRSLDDLLEDKRFAKTTRHLRKVFVDPMTGKDTWGFVMLGDRIVGVHSLSDVQPIKQANFEDDDRTFAGRTKVSDWVFSFPFDLSVMPTTPILNAPVVPSRSASGSSG